MTADELVRDGTLELAPGPGIRLAGTFYHQDALRPAVPRIPSGESYAVRRVPVRLRHDPTSAHTGAVAVEHEGRLLGHLPRACAPMFHDVLSCGEDEGRAVTATAVLQCSVDDPYVSVDVEALPPGVDGSCAAGRDGAARSGASDRWSRRRGLGRARRLLGAGRVRAGAAPDLAAV